jgi:hypothetical protein
MDIRREPKSVVSVSVDSPKRLRWQAVLCGEVLLAQLGRQEEVIAPPFQATRERFSVTRGRVVAPPRSRNLNQQGLPSLTDDPAVREVLNGGAITSSA